ncbi:MAG TPA: efflux RND transporter periplasmic adaptor subunit [Symbiobacteriaceae bacterium]|nr:efflux RND transporter periplasmic adaptor subunit [Symbiobacteriaceae bacterium]
MKKQIVPAALVALLASGCSLLPKEAAAPVIDVQAAQVTQREVAPVKRGTIEARQTIAVTFGAPKQSALYFRSSGRVKRLYAVPGQKVEAGALLAELESGSLPYDLQLAEIELEKARLNLTKAQGRIGFTDEPSETELKRLDLELKAAELRLQQKREQLADTKLYAPFAGEVVSVSTSEGATAEAYKELLLLAGTGGVVGRATVDEATAVKLEPGQAVDIYPSDGNPAPVRGKVLTVPQVGGQDKTLVVAPDQPSDRLRVGRNGKADVVLQSKANVLLVPLSAIRTFGGRKFVTVVEGETRREVAIKTGLESDQHAEVLEGLQEGDRVVSR